LSPLETSQQTQRRCCLTKSVGQFQRLRSDQGNIAHAIIDIGLSVSGSEAYPVLKHTEHSRTCMSLATHTWIPSTDITQFQQSRANDNPFYIVFPFLEIQSFITIHKCPETALSHRNLLFRGEACRFRFLLLKLRQYLFARFRAIEDDEGEQRDCTPGDDKVVSVLSAPPVGKVVVDAGIQSCLNGEADDGA
jgi:hypothetical protein